MRTKGWRWFEGLRGRTVLRLLFVLMSSRKRRRKLKRVRQRKRKTVSRLEASRGWGGRERQIKKGYPTMTYLFWHLSFLKRKKKKIAPWPQKCTTVWPRLGKCWGLLVRVFWEHHTRERRRDCTCKRRSIACHVPRAADYRLLLFKNTRNQVDLCRKMLLTHANSDALKGILDFFIT